VGSTCSNLHVPTAWATGFKYFSILTSIKITELLIFLHFLTPSNKVSINMINDRRHVLMECSRQTFFKTGSFTDSPASICPPWGNTLGFETQTRCMQCQYSGTERRKFTHCKLISSYIQIFSLLAFLRIHVTDVHNVNDFPGEVLEPRFGVLTAVMLKIKVFWDVTLCC